MLSLKVMILLVFILLSMQDTTIAHTTTTTDHDQVKQKIGVDEAGNNIDKLGEKRVYDGHYIPTSIQVGRKEMEEGGNMMSKEDLKDSAATKSERKMRMLQTKLAYGKVNRATLMALTDADYSDVPTTHPPRHNDTYY